MENIPTGRAGRGDAWKAYQKQKRWVPGERPRISSPIPIARGPLGEQTASNSLQPPRKPDVSKSRSHHVFSSLTQSLSRASLSRANNRGAPGRGTPPKTAQVPKSSGISLSRFSKKPIETTSEKEEPQQGPPNQSPQYSSRPFAPPELDNPQKVARAMPFPYWTGRFMTLHDQFQSEMLEPEHINIVIKGQVAGSSLCNEVRPTQTAAAQAVNNPSTSVYANKRIPRLSLGNYTPPIYGEQERKSSTKRTGRIPYSLTSNSISVPPSEGRDISSPTVSCLRGPRSQPASRLPSYEQAVAMDPSLLPLPLVLPRRKTLDENAPKASKKKQPSPEKELERAMLIGRAVALTDEISLCRRVILHLESMCTTDEATRSLHSWQQEYARTTKREDFLPLGGTMRDPRPERKVSAGLVGRLEGLLGRKNVTVGNIGESRELGASPKASRRTSMGPANVAGPRAKNAKKIGVRPAAMWMVA